MHGGVAGDIDYKLERRGTSFCWQLLLDSKKSNIISRGGVINWNGPQLFITRHDSPLSSVIQTMRFANPGLHQVVRETPHNLLCHAQIATHFATSSLHNLQHLTKNQSSISPLACAERQSTVQYCKRFRACDLFPLNRAGGLAGDVHHHTIHPFHLIDDSIRNRLHQVVRETRPICCHLDTQRRTIGQA